MPLVRAQRLLNSIEAGTTNATALQALFAADAGRLAEFGSLIGMRGQARRAVAAATSRAAIFGSALAAEEFFKQGNGLPALEANSYAIADVSASSTMMTGIMASDAGRRVSLGSATLTTSFGSNIPAMNVIAASSACRTLVGTGTGTRTTAYNSFASQHMAVAKMTAGFAGLTVTSYDTTRSLYDATSTFTTLSGSLDAVRYAMNSDIVGVLEGQAAAGTNSALTADTGSPVTVVNSSASFFLFLARGCQVSATPFLSLSGTNQSPTASSWIPSVVDVTMGSLANTTIAKLRALAEASSTNRDVRRMQGPVTVNETLAVSSPWVGYIVIPTSL